MRDIDESNAVIFYLESGKPDPENPEQRKIQAAQKGLTCTYYAMHRIRDRYAKTDTSQGRANEKLVSQHRKKMTTLSGQLEFECVLIAKINEFRQQHSALITSKVSDEQQVYWREFLSHYAKENPPSREIKQEDEKQWLTTMVSDPHFSEFVFEKQKKRLIALYKEMLSNYGVTIDALDFELPSDLIEDAILQQASNKRSSEISSDSWWSLLNSTAQIALLISCVTSKQAELYGLQQGVLSTEKEFQDFTIDDMLALLREKKSMVMMGEIGRHYYKSEDIKTCSIGRNSFFSFKPNSFNSKYSTTKHSIVVVGASKAGYENTTQDLIYFVDPLDPSAPNQPTKIYVMSFKNFKERMQKTAYFYLKNKSIKNASFLYFFKPSVEEDNTKSQSGACTRLTSYCTIL